MTVEYYGFEWDDEKNLRNLRIHGIMFEDAVRVFNDPFLLEKYNVRHSSEEEDRFIGIGRLKTFFVTFVSYTDRKGKSRMISARKATGKEVKEYERHRKSLQTD